MDKPFVVLFGGVPGTSKSIIAHHLSCTYHLPIYANDTLRFEISEDMMIDNNLDPELVVEFEKRNQQRRQTMLSGKKPIIFDNSVDRSWAKQKRELTNAGYNWYLINMELSRPFLTQLFHSTGRIKFADRIDYYLKEHEQFIAKHSNDISLNVTDNTFRNRLHHCETGLQTFIDSLQTQTETELVLNSIPANA